MTYWQITGAFLTGLWALGFTATAVWAWWWFLEDADGDALFALLTCTVMAALLGAASVHIGGG